MPVKLYGGINMDRNTERRVLMDGMRKRLMAYAKYLKKLQKAM